MTAERIPGRFDQTVVRLVPADEGESPDPLLGKVLDGRYEIRELMGIGGMGTVYRAYQSSIDRDVAIKVVRPENGTDPVAIKRFLREARLASQVSHPSLVVVHDFGHTHDGLLFLVMELVEGNTLQEELRSGQTMELERFLRIGMQLCGALGAAHHQGVIHRDIKPSNIMLSTTGGREIVKVLDFGLAKSTRPTSIKLTKSTQQLGTPLYMAPEMIRAEQIDERSDVYQLGCTLYEMAAGYAPFSAKTVEMLFVMHLEQPPKPLERDDLGDLRAAILSMLAKEPAERPSRIDDVHAIFERRLTQVLGANSGTAKDDPWHKKWFLVGGAVVLAALVIVLGVSLASKSPGTETNAAPQTAAVVVQSQTPPPKEIAEGAPNETAPVEAAPVEGAPNEGAPNEAAPNEGAPNETAQNGTADGADAAPKRAIRERALVATPPATVFLDGEEIGKTPMSFSREDSQSVTLEFRAPGYNSERQRIDENSADEIAVTLSKRAKRKRPRGAKPKPVETAPIVEPPKPAPTRPKPIFRVRR
jgi:tRNA A-37 threonylcarbamoyl transferase component Bud32